MVTPLRLRACLLHREDLGARLDSAIEPGGQLTHGATLKPKRQRAQQRTGLADANFVLEDLMVHQHMRGLSCVNGLTMRRDAQRHQRTKRGLTTRALRVTTTQNNNARAMFTHQRREPTLPTRRPAAREPFRQVENDEPKRSRTQEKLGRANELMRTTRNVNNDERLEVDARVCKVGREERAAFGLHPRGGLAFGLCLRDEGDRGGHASDGELNEATCGHRVGERGLFEPEGELLLVAKSIVMIASTQALRQAKPIR